MERTRSGNQPQEGQRTMATINPDAMPPTLIYEATTTAHTITREQAEALTSALTSLEHTARAAYEARDYDAYHSASDSARPIIEQITSSGWAVTLDTTTGTYTLAESAPAAGPEDPEEPAPIYQRYELEAFLGEPDDYDVNAIEAEATRATVGGTRVWVAFGDDLAAIAERHELYSYAPAI